MLKPGIYEDLPTEEYFEGEAFSKSLYHATMRSARHLREYLENGEKKPGMLFGSLLDAILLQPEELKKFPILPETYINSKGKEMPFTLQSKTCREVKAQLEAQGTPVTAEQMRTAETMAESVRQHPAARELLEGSKKQVSMVWEDPETGVLCRGRIDLVNDEAVIDLKKTRNAAADSFSRDIFNFGYHVQAAMYTDAWKLLTGQELGFKFICAESEPPYCVAVYDFDEEGIECGRINARIAMLKYKGYMEDDPDLTQGYSNVAEPINVPRWAIETTFKKGEFYGI